jgi:hypothetical protein
MTHSIKNQSAPQCNYSYGSSQANKQMTNEMILKNGELAATAAVAAASNAQMRSNFNEKRLLVKLIKATNLISNQQFLSSSSRFFSFFFNIKPTAK